jgi:hypothetical protein
MSWRMWLEDLKKWQRGALDVMKTELGGWCVAVASLASGGSSDGGLPFGGAPWVPSLDVQGENPRFGLYWLYLTMSLLEALFLELRIFPGWKLNIYDLVTITCVHCLLFRGVALENLFYKPRAVLVGVCVLLPWLITLAGFFFFRMGVCILNV